MSGDGKLRTLLATKFALEEEFGSLADLPVRLVDSLANVYFRHLEAVVDSNFPTFSDEYQIRLSDFKSATGAVHAFRQAERDRPPSAPEWVLDVCIDTFIDKYTYRIPNAVSKTLLRRTVERKFRRNLDIPNLANMIQQIHDIQNRDRAL